MSKISYVVTDHSGVYHCRDSGRSTGATLCGAMFLLRDARYDTPPAGLKLCELCKKALDEREGRARRKGMIIR